MSTVLTKLRAVLGEFRTRPADGGSVSAAGPRDGSVRAPDRRDQDWIDLAAELTPAKSLVRIDTAVTRVTSAVTVLGTLITGFGLYAANYPSAPQAARWLALAATVSAALAVVGALAGQLVSVTIGLNTADLLQVQLWYRRRFRVRVPLVRLAMVLLVVAACLVGAAAAVVAVNPPVGAQLSVSRVRQPSGSDLVTVEATIRGLKSADRAVMTIAVDSVTIAGAGLTPGPDGTVTRSLAVDKIDPGAVVSILVRAGRLRCTSELRPRQEPIQVDCR